MVVDTAPVDTPPVLVVDDAQVTVRHCSKVARSVVMRLDRYAVAIDDGIADDAARMTENRRARYRRRLHPRVFARVVALHQVDVAEVVPATDQVNVTIIEGDG